MRIQGPGPTYQTAESHPSYLSKPGVDRAFEALRAANELRAEGVADRRIDAIAQHLNVVVAAQGWQAERADWSCPQRIVWRYALTDQERRMSIVADQSISDKVTAFASINASRWVVTCPTPGCGSAQMASWHDQRFFCCDCLNRVTGGRWVRVVWPRDPQAIENIVNHRPYDARNWWPGETSEDIQAQDVRHLTRGM